MANQVGPVLSNSDLSTGLRGRKRNQKRERIFHQGQEVYRNPWQLPPAVNWTLECLLRASPYPMRTGQHVEHRVGMVNFSIVGRAATADERHAYYVWDQQHAERLALAQHIRTVWPDLDVSVAGESGIDISALNTGKQQILPRIADHAPIWFFGDRQEPGGNDHGLAQAIQQQHLGMNWAVTDWQHTLNILTQEME